MRIAEKVFCEIAETLSEDKLKSLSENTFISEEKSIAEHFEKRVEERFESLWRKAVAEAGKDTHISESYFYKINIKGERELDLEQLKDIIVNAENNYVGIDKNIYIKWGIYTFVITKVHNKEMFSFLTLLEPSKNNITFETKKAINYTRYKKILRARKAAAKAKAEAASE